jgi:adenylate cyclase
MSDVFISYGHSTAARQARGAAEALRLAGYSVWLDDDLPAHRAFTPEIEAQLTAAKAALVIWSVEGAKSHWVLSEANRAREDNKLVQLRIDEARLPMPFDQIQCADLSGWSGDGEHPAWGKVAASVADLVRRVGSHGSVPNAVAALPLPDKPSLAVMPFANLSGDPEQDYFADGMVVEIVEALSRCRSIFVIASSSTLALKRRGLTAQEAARQLGVRYALEGSVRKAGGRRRIGVQLIDATDGAQVWAHRFEDAQDDVFALQDDIATTVAGVIEPAMHEDAFRRAAGRPTDNMGAYELYLRAHALVWTYEREETLKAVTLLERAIELDPNYARALAVLGYCHHMIATLAWTDDVDLHAHLSRELGARARVAGSNDADVLAYTAQFLFSPDDLDTGRALLDRAISINPGSSIAWTFSGWAYVLIGEPGRAIDHLGRAMRFDPFSSARSMHLAGVGIAEFQLRRFDAALAALREAAELRANDPVPYPFIASILGLLGRTNEASATLAKYRALEQTALDLYGRRFLYDPTHLALFLEGIERAGATSASPASAGNKP